MAAQFTWKVMRMDLAPTVGNLKDVVVSAYWRCFGADGSTGAMGDGLVSFPAPQAQTFIPYDRLSESTVLGWVYAGLDKTAVETSVQAQMQAAATPTISTKPLPWPTGS